MHDRLVLALDTLLEKTVVLSYTSVGYFLRRRTWDPADLEVDLSGKTCIVTGANSGLGFSTAERLASLGAGIHLLVRNPVAGREAQQAIVYRTGNQKVGVELVDVSSLQAIRTFAERFQETQTRLDVLVHNAGVLLDRRQLSADGFELTFATHVLGPFLLTHLLRPLLEHSAPARVIWVSSAGMYTQRLEMDDLTSAQGPFNGTVAYAQTKRAQVVLSELWAEQFAGKGVAVNAVHPGWVDTPGLRKSLPGFARTLRLALRTPPQGADTIVWLAAAPHLDASGRFWFDRRPRPTHRLAHTQASQGERQKIWDTCTTLCGLGEGDLAA